MRRRIFLDERIFRVLLKTTHCGSGECGLRSPELPYEASSAFNNYYFSKIFVYNVK